MLLLPRVALLYIRCWIAQARNLYRFDTCYFYNPSSWKWILRTRISSKHGITAVTVDCFCKHLSSQRYRLIIDLSNVRNKEETLILIAIMRQFQHKFGFPSMENVMSWDTSFIGGNRPRPGSCEEYRKVSLERFSSRKCLLAFMLGSCWANKHLKWGRAEEKKTRGWLTETSMSHLE